MHAFAVTLLAHTQTHTRRYSVCSVIDISTHTRPIYTQTQWVAYNFIKKKIKNLIKSLARLPAYKNISSSRTCPPVRKCSLYIAVNWHIIPHYAASHTNIHKAKLNPSDNQKNLQRKYLIKNQYKEFKLVFRLFNYYRESSTVIERIKLSVCALYSWLLSLWDGDATFYSVLKCWQLSNSEWFEPEVCWETDGCALLINLMQINVGIGLDCNEIRYYDRLLVYQTGFFVHVFGIVSL